MKKLVLLLVLSLLTINDYGQEFCYGYVEHPEFNFEDSMPMYYSLYIDTISNPNNIWQIGLPQKDIINIAFSLPNVIITDTVNSYPAKDTSFFIIKNDVGGIPQVYAAEMAGYYCVNSDSLKDCGIIEISIDLGISWINLITDTLYSAYYQWLTPKPILTGNSYGWQYFWIDLTNLAQILNIEWGDILYKYSFRSDTLQESMDGLAFDNLQFCELWEGIPEIQNNDLIIIYPNPAKELLQIKRTSNSSQARIEIYDQFGCCLLKMENFISDYIDVGQLKLGDGLYFLKYSDSKEFTFVKFIISK